MKILFVSATKTEIQGLLAELGAPVEVSSKHFVYNYSGNQIEILITGVGMVFTSIYLSMQLQHRMYDLVINAGIAGAIDRNLQLGEVLQVVNDHFYELGAEDGEDWLSPFRMGILGDNDLPYTEKGIHNHFQFGNESLDSLKIVDAVTVNTVHGNEKTIAVLRQRSNAQIESMEGAAFLLCCAVNKQKCMQIRAISNYVEKRNKANWEIGLAIKNLNDYLFNLLQNLT